MEAETDRVRDRKREEERGGELENFTLRERETHRERQRE